MEFAEKMKLLLKEQGWTQREFARRAEMDITHANKFFTGRKPNFEFIQTVRKIFSQVDLNWLLVSDTNDEGVTLVDKNAAPYNIKAAVDYLEEIEEKLGKMKTVLSQN